MKIGLFWDNAINIKSYYVKNGTAYDLETNQPYMYHHTVSEKPPHQTVTYQVLLKGEILMPT